MNIEKVRDNLKNTIAGKQLLLARYQEDLKLATFSEYGRLHDVIAFLELNLTELKTILADVESCCGYPKSDSWRGEVDRQGGSFTSDELDPNRGWQ